MKEINTFVKEFDADKFMIIEAILSAIIVFASVLYKGNIVSLAFTASFLVLLVFFVIFFVKVRFDTITTLLIFSVAISLVNVLSSLLLANKAIAFSSLTSYISFACTLIFFCLAVYHKINKKTERFFYQIQMIIALAYPFCYYFVTMYTNHTYALAFNFSNPNLAGIFILQSILYMCLGAIRYEEILIKVVFIALAVIDFWLILKTDSRNVLLSTFVFLAFVVWSFIKQKYSFSNFMLFLFSSAPILFVPIYLFYIEVIIEKGWFSFLVSEGKDLDSRVGVWKSFFSKLGGKWITGNYANALGNAHNAQMVILCSFGLVVLILVILFTYKILQKVNKNSKTFYDSCCISAFFAILFMGIGEGALYSGAIGIYILAGSFLFLVNVDEKEMKKTVTHSSMPIFDYNSK